MRYWLWLASLENIGCITKKKLLEKFKNPEKIFFASKKDLLSIDGITNKIVDEIKNNKDELLLKKYEVYIKKNKIAVINIFDDEYPETLKNIYDPPITLFAKGNLDLLKKNSIAMVGCREPSEYGINVAKNMAKELSENGLVIVSGMARGIDTFSHIGAINGTGETISVLGSGIDIVYPKENINLYRKILEKGLILSEYIVGTKPYAFNFPQRNRIISGISKGVLVVEAQMQSGTMITTDFALSQGKELYVIPGNIYSKTSKGTNELIKQGAKVVTDVQDILEDLN